MGAFIVGVILSLPVLIGLIFLDLVLEHNEHDGWSLFVTLLIVALVWNMFTFPLNLLLIAAAAYFPVGLLWSFWRWRRHCSRVVADVKKNPSQKADGLRKLDLSEQIFRIVSWILNWPASALASLLGDIIDVIEVLVRKVFHKVYVRISRNAIKELEKI